MKIQSNRNSIVLRLRLSVCAHECVCVFQFLSVVFFLECLLLSLWRIVSDWVRVRICWNKKAVAKYAGTAFVWIHTEVRRNSDIRLVNSIPYTRYDGMASFYSLWRRVSECVCACILLIFLFVCTRLLMIFCVIFSYTTCVCVCV